MLYSRIPNWEPFRESYTAGMWLDSRLQLAELTFEVFRAHACVLNPEPLGLGFGTMKPTEAVLKHFESGL